MLPKFFTNELLSNLFNTGIILVVMFLLYWAGHYVFVKKLDKDKMRERARIRLVYVISILSVFFVAKTWVTGFTHLFYGLSLVSAGLVVTNKESIMNMVGSMIIKWRGLFAEGDYIQMDKYSGFVHELGFLYFKLFEVSDISIRRSSGRMVKIPNGLVINNPVINYSLQNNVIEYKQSWIISPESPVELAKEIVANTMRESVKAFYAENPHYSRKAMKKNCRRLAHLIDLEVHVKTQMRFDKPSGIEIMASYYCYPHDKDLLDERLRIRVLDALQTSGVVKLTFVS
jgi:small-conductance mechanosensitive channel